MEKDINTSSICEQKETGLEKKSNSNLYLARHLTLDYYDCDADILHNKRAKGKKSVLETL
jgi:hypothetical protein